MSLIFLVRIRQNSAGALALMLLFLTSSLAWAGMTPSEVNDFKRDKIDAEKGDVKSQYNLAQCYYHGWGVEKDYAQAVNWYRKAAMEGFSGAQYNLGTCYYFGEGTPKDAKLAVHWFKKAAQQGDAWAMNNLGQCYFLGDGTDTDYGQAVYWYRKAAKEGLAEAQVNLAQCYTKRAGVAYDPSQIFYWFERAAEQGNPIALCNLGNCYFYGVGVTKDETEAYAYYKVSENDSELGARNAAMTEKELPIHMIIAGKKRAKELKQKIEANIEAKKEIAAKKAGK